MPSSRNAVLRLVAKILQKVLTLVSCAQSIFGKPVDKTEHPLFYEPGEVRLDFGTMCKHLTSGGKYENPDQVLKDVMKMVDKSR